jgi:hypothetical protein
VKYIGRGDAPTRVQNHSITPGKEDLSNKILFDNNLAKAEGKGLEQRLIDHFGGAQSQNANTPLLNKINGVSSTNPNAGNYRSAATDELFNEALRRINGQ